VILRWLVGVAWPMVVGMLWGSAIYLAIAGALIWWPA